MKAKIIILAQFLFFSFSTFGRNVMTWIPTYGTTKCKALMNDPTTSDWLKNGLTHIGLQFWVPGDKGAVEFVTNYQYTYKASSISQDATDFAAWGKANNVKVMLCIYNVRDADFDWTYARQAFNDYPTQTITNIMSIVNNYSLNGVDIDFEGSGDFRSDKTAFVHFLDLLGAALHAAGKELSVDMFSTPCYNAPNTSWESVMAPYVDFMNVMGYADTYEGNSTLIQYCTQTPSEANTYPLRYSYIENYLTVKQAVSSSKLNYGIPSDVASWGDKCPHENILDIMNISSSGGIAIWDLQLDANGIWKEEVTWDLISMFKNNKTSSQVRSDLLVCGLTTSIDEPNKDGSPLIFDSLHQVVKCSGEEGQVLLYSTNGALTNSWKVKEGEEVSLSNVANGFYILRFHGKTGEYSIPISLLK
jgi:chitinase